jgi:predicted phosphodiesterase
MSTRGAVVVVALAALVCGCGSRAVGPVGDPGELGGLAGWKGAAPNAPDAFRFVVMSDRTGDHAEGEWSAAVAQINLLRPDFVVCVGDLIEGYTDDADELQREWDELDAMTRELDAPFFYCPGNHDVTNDMMREYYIERHGVDGRAYYSFDFRGCHFVVLDITPSPRPRTLFDEEMAWLKDDLAAAADAKHVFVFYHEPLWEGKLWPRIAEILPKDRTTVFNGHWHQLAYQLADGIPTYVLAGTASAYETVSRASGEFRMFAQVTVNRGEPTIALVPLHETLPAEFAGFTTTNQEMMGKGSLTSHIPASGGTVEFHQDNTLDIPVTLNCRWDAPDWRVDPPDGEVEIAPGASAGEGFVLTPTVPSPARPEIRVTYTMRPAYAAGPIEGASAFSPTVYQQMDLPRAQAVVTDGALGDWPEGETLAIDRADQVATGAENWTGPGDASYKLRAAHDGKSLLLGVEVADDQIVTVPGASWNADGLQVHWAIDADEAKADKGVEGAVLVNVPDAGAPAGASWYVSGRPVPTARQVAVRRTDSGYVCELAIPLAEIGAEKLAAGGQSLRLEVVLSDRDVQDGKAAISSLSSCGRRARSGTMGYIRIRLGS